MASNASRGARWKARSRKWLTDHGYVAVDLEIIRTMFTPNGTFPKKQDQLGSDLMGVNGDGYLWVQVKGYGLASKRPSLAAARRLFAQFPLPPCTVRAIHLWRHGAREPEVIYVDSKGEL